MKNNAMMRAELEDVMSYSNNAFNVGSNQYKVGDFYQSWGYWNTYPYYPHTTYITNTVETKPNPFELSFKIVSKMLEKKIIERLTVKQFIETINEIAKLI